MDTYTWLLRELGTWLDDHQVERAEDLVADVVHRWLDSQLEAGWSTSARRLGSIVARGVLRWGAREGYGVPPTLWERIEPVERPESAPRALEPEDLQRILAHYTRARGLEQLRDRALFLFLLTTGSRITAALSLERDQIGRSLVVVLKGGAEHTLLPSAAAMAWVHDYLRARGRDQQPALWIRVGKTGRHRLDMTSANRIWARLAAKLRIPVFTCHALRHTAVSELQDRGVSDTDITLHLGWRSNAMMTRYRRLRDERRQELVDQLDDLIPKLPSPPAPAPRRRPRVS